MPANTKPDLSTDPEVWILDWPDRFLVERRTEDDEYPEVFFPYPDPDPYSPYLVDLGELEGGFCGCRDFECNVLPYLRTSNQRRTKCRHIIACERYLANFTKQPTKLPTEIKFK